MKTSILQALLVVILLPLCLSAIAQRPITWKGGTPGKNTEWHCPQNWNTSSVPDEFSDVIIPDVSASSHALPVIRSGIIEINSLCIQHNGKLTIDANAELIILGYTVGMTRHNILGQGSIILQSRSSGMVDDMASGGQ